MARQRETTRLQHDARSGLPQHLVVLGMGTIDGCWAINQAKEICAGVAPLRTAQSEMSCTSGRLAARWA